ncbi:hypothetical protein Tco_0718060 [Tanacetum coccineum]
MQRGGKLKQGQGGEREEKGLICRCKPQRKLRKSFNCLRIHVSLLGFARAAFTMGHNEAIWLSYPDIEKTAMVTRGGRAFLTQMYAASPVTATSAVVVAIDGGGGCGGGGCSGGACDGGGCGGGGGGD